MNSLSIRRNVFTCLTTYNTNWIDSDINFKMAHTIIVCSHELNTIRLSSDCARDWLLQSDPIPSNLINICVPIIALQPTRSLCWRCVRLIRVQCGVTGCRCQLMHSNTVILVVLLIIVIQQFCKSVFLHVKQYLCYIKSFSYLL